MPTSKTTPNDTTDVTQTEKAKEEDDERVVHLTLETPRKYLQSSVTLSLEVTWKVGGGKCFERDCTQSAKSERSGREENGLELNREQKSVF